MIEEKGIAPYNGGESGYYCAPKQSDWEISVVVDTERKGSHYFCNDLGNSYISITNLAIDDIGS